MLEGGEEVSTGVGRRLSLGLRLGELVNRVPVVGDPLLLLMLLFVGAIGLRLGEFVLEGGEEVSTDVGRRLSLGLRLGELVNRESVVGDPLLLLVLVGAIGLRLGEYVLEGGEEVSTDVGKRLSLGLRLGELVNRVSVVGDPMLLLLVLFCTMLGVSVGPSSILPF